jgi:hypothetical protein
MCTGLEFLGVAMSAVGSAMQANAAMAAARAQANAIRVQSEAAARQAEYQAELIEQNRKVALQQAETAGARGKIEEERLRMEGRAFKGAQRAAGAASGVDISVGSPLSLVADSAMLVEQDAAMSRFNTMAEKWGFQAEAAGLEGRKRLALFEAKNDRALGELGAENALYTGRLNSTASLLAGASSVASQWMQWKGGGAAGAGVGTYSGKRIGYADRWSSWWGRRNAW